MVSKPRVTIGAKGHGPGSGPIAAVSDENALPPDTENGLATGSANVNVSVSGTAGKLIH